jgi:SAM-dependent methyltransferase
VLIEQLDLAAGQVLLDLGCGSGGTLLAASRAVPGLSLIGCDVSPEALAIADQLLAGHDAQFRPNDLDLPLPIADGSVDRIVTHNALECIADPAALMAEAARVVRPGGRAVWSHVDFDALILTSADPDLGRRVIHSYADTALGWMRNVDGQMGRKLAGLVRASPLDLLGVRVATRTFTELQGDALVRVEETTTSLRTSDHHDLTGDDLAAWRGGIDDLAGRGEFFLAEPSVVATSVRPVP